LVLHFDLRLHALLESVADSGIRTWTQDSLHPVP